MFLLNVLVDSEFIIYMTFDELVLTTHYSILFIFPINIFKKKN